LLLLLLLLQILNEANIDAWHYDWLLARLSLSDRLLALSLLEMLSPLRPLRLFLLEAVVSVEQGRHSIQQILVQMQVLLLLN